MQNKVFSNNKTLNAGGRLISLDTPKIMGILNLTPDSFFDGGKHATEKAALAQVEKMIGDGAEFLDVGGYSTRPGAEHLNVEEEISRTIPIIKAITKNFPTCVVSIDTFRSEVARHALEEGALMVNDVSGGELDPEMFDLVAKYHVPYILMHMKGTPQTMKSMANYQNIFKEMTDYFHGKITQLHAQGVADVLIDPGFGFAKTIEQNFEVLKHLEHFKVLEKPLVVGLSRKSMIWKTLDTTPENALNGTTVLNTIALIKGAGILRIHDVKEAVEAVKLTNFVR
ncbi:MAG TPA: dihydropteroate synthase [Cytophagales bacterium]|mgnify:CR=1 FL=1|nr:dihydropteroate synthase [Cytophagales bacterium]HCR52865.1 dihydropteroate synthase [Cytophagales bacterium]